MDSVLNLLAVLFVYASLAVWKIFSWVPKFMDFLATPSNLVTIAIVCATAWRGVKIVRCLASHWSGGGDGSATGVRGR